PLSDVTAWRVGLFFACVNFLFYALIAWTAPMLREAGLPASNAGLVLACFTAVFTVASLVMGVISRSVDRRRWLGVCSVLATLGLLSLALCPARFAVASISTSALGLGGAFTLGMMLPIDYTQTAEEANSWNAFVMTVGYLIAAAGPVLVGAL